MHLKWKKNKLGTEPGIGGFAMAEIDESSIIWNRDDDVFWMFGVIDRITKDARVFSVLNNRTKHKLLPIIKNSVASNSNFDEDDNDLVKMINIK